MAEADEKELKLLVEILPSISQHMRISMVNLYTAASCIATPAMREQDPKLDRYAAVMTKSSYELMRLSGNLSEIGELTNTSRYQLYNDDIIGFCEHMCKKSQMLFESLGLQLEFIPEKSSHIIAMDAGRLERLLLNLFSNAMKFTPSGGKVTLRVKISDRFVKISVSDTGCGIEAERLESVFDSYLDTEHSDALRGGLGLGLPICRRIARGHGGTIVVESGVGEGTTVTVMLPNVKSPIVRVKDVRFDYAGGFNHVLMELSDALKPDAFSQKFLD